MNYASHRKEGLVLLPQPNYFNFGQGNWHTKDVKFYWPSVVYNFCLVRSYQGDHGVVTTILIMDHNFNLGQFNFNFFLCSHIVTMILLL